MEEQRLAAGALRARQKGIREALTVQAEPDYAAFTTKLMRKPGEEKPSGSASRVLGVRLPALRKLARQLGKEAWRESVEALFEAVREPDAFFEERMLLGFVIGCAGKEVSVEERLALVRDFLPFIDNWSLCDSFCAGLKFTNRAREQVWEFLQPLLQAQEEYSVRFALVMFLDYFITEDYVEQLFARFDSVRHDGYYVKMAAAWAVSICYVKFPEQTGRYLREDGLDDFTHNKALQKIAESRRVSDEERRALRELKR